MEPITPQQMKSDPQITQIVIIRELTDYDFCVICEICGQAHPAADGRGRRQDANTFSPASCSCLRQLHVFGGLNPVSLIGGE